MIVSLREWSVFLRLKTATPVEYRGADKSLARPTSRCILFDCENISFDASFVIYISGNNIPPIMIINRLHETQNLVVACFLPVRAKDLSAPLYILNKEPAAG